MAFKKTIVRCGYYVVVVSAIIFPVCLARQELHSQENPANVATTSYEIQRGLAFAEKLRTEQSQSASIRKPAPAPAQLVVSASPEFANQLESMQSDTQQTLEALKKIEQEILALEESIAELGEITKLKADFVKDEPMVRHYLSALFAHGYSQPDKGAKHKRTSVLGPVSLAALQKFGALEPTENGMLQLGHAGADPSNDRGRQAFPKNIGGGLDQHEFEFLLPAQKYLIKYQKLLVHNGLLAP